MSVRYAFLAGFALLACGQASAACMPGPFPMTIPPQRLDERLQDLSHKTGCFMEMSPEAAQLQNRQTPGISGSFTTEQALRWSLSGSRLHAVHMTSPEDHWKIQPLAPSDTPQAKEKAGK
ncbi:hypothetical protein [Gluconobacter morbifer]|nr:hypothetical protein [Gluconobacter morbifer]